MKELKGKEYWRSLDQLADTPEFRQMLEREFPEGASEMKNPVSRRNFLAMMGASLALAGLTACRRPVEKIVPYVKAPEQTIPGVPKYYATTMPLGTSAYGVVVENHDGRPTKIEGNEKHPASLGKSNSFMQAAILALYDPDRAQRPSQNGVETDWAAFVSMWKSLYAEYKKNDGAGLAVLSDAFAAPSKTRLMQEFKQTFPAATWVTYAPVTMENVYKGIEAVTGSAWHPLYRFERAKVILALDHDFLLSENENIVHARGFADGRRVTNQKDEMNRLYAVESTYTLTGGMADHRLRLANNRIPAFTVMLANALKTQGVSLAIDLPVAENDPAIDTAWVSAVARDLLRQRGAGLVTAGAHQPTAVHALVFAINTALGNVGKTVGYRDLTDINEGSVIALADLTGQMEAGKIETLIILGGNPVYNAPADLAFDVALGKVKNTIHLSAETNETAIQVAWHLPESHFLEAWGDARAVDGTLSLIQPMIAPLFETQSSLEVLHLLTYGEEKKGYDITRDTWKKIITGADFEKNWRRILHDGVLAGSALKEITPALKNRTLTASQKNELAAQPLPDKDNLEITFRVSPAVYDGRFANNGWLQELPNTITKLSWDNAALVSHKTAQALGVKNEDVVTLNLDGRTLDMAVWILPGQAEFSVDVMLGYGRTAAGRIGNAVGFNAYQLRTTDRYHQSLGLTINKTGRTHEMANTQDHNSMEGRPLVREATLEEYRKDPKFADEMVEHPPLVSLWDEHSYTEGNQWGMTIDLNSCTGCNACAIACQSENNVPVIGREQVRNGREMHWIRLDRYFAGDIDDPEMVHQPVACQHCEMAPCEQVCPVAATVHDKEGLNLMTYNRCVGTRYCSNNCPYKVRRFNFFNYTNTLPDLLKMVQNPDVTVRSRGVMEKCTYCVQRISAAKISAKNQGKPLVDGDVTTACEQACPTNAIVFGNIIDPESAVSKAKQSNRRYEMLAELNIKPRTSYLAKLRNPNPELQNS